MNSWGASATPVLAPDREQETREQPNPIRVLIADDDEMVRRTLARIISSRPGLALVGSAKDADEAIRIGLECRPDVAVVDVGMPGGGGARVAESLTTDLPGTKVLALSGSTNRDGVMEMLAAGASGYVVKAAGLNLVAAVEATYRGEGILTSEIASDVIGELGERLSRQRVEDRRRDARVASIREAIAGDFHMVFQPVVHLGSETRMGYEALARFHGQPYRAPDRWFAAAAELGLGFELETAAVSAAVDSMETAIWARATGEFLAVNLSPPTIVDPRFAGWLRTLRRPGDLIIEVTEHAEVEDYRRLDRALRLARAMGARVSVDDAGSGYSSLRHIVLLKPDVVKLDGSLVNGISRDPAKRAAAMGIIASARELETAVIAEALEDHADLDCVKRLGADMGQGYLLGRPGPLPPTQVNQQ